MVSSSLLALLSLSPSPAPGISPSRLWNFYPLRARWPTASRKGTQESHCHVDEHGGSSCWSSDRVLRCRLAKIGVERCESGRIDMLGNHASQQWDRGFESHPLRHMKT